ncbi:MAG: methyltransferase domain-containing protein [Planctomycetota bacterium]
MTPTPSPLPPIEAIPDLPIDEALALAARKFDTAAIVDRTIDLDGVAEYYRQSDRGYRLFHSREGALHIALGCDGHRDTSGYARQADLFHEQLEAVGAHPAAGRSAIEFGCGMGFNTRWLAEHCPDRRFVGVDLTASHVRYARKRAARLPNAEFIEGNYERLARRDAEFDGVLAVETLCQTPRLGRALAEARRVLRPGGRLVVIDCFRSGEPDFYGESMRRAMHLVEKTTAVNAFATVDEWVDAAAEAGLSLVETRDLSLETEANLRRLYSLSRRFFTMSAVVRAMARAFPPLLLENSICGLLMPYTVGAGAHQYQMLVVEKA